MPDAALPRATVLTTSRPFAIVGGLVALVIVASVWAISVGAVAIPANVIVNTLFNLPGEQQT